MRQSNTWRLWLLCGSAALLSGAWQSTAAAQPAALAVEAANPAGDEGTAVEEIVVTANKRQQSLLDVGASLAAVSGEALKAQHIVSLSDLATTVPGLSYTPTSTATPVYTLRGVGFYESSLANYPTTSVYVDEVPLPFPALTTHANFDLERVEVLKGPQGTLFGQNSTGGAINFIAAKPTADFEAGGDLTYGRFNRIETNGYISGPLTDTLRARLAVTSAHGDDWQYSYTRDDTLGETEFYGARLLLDWRPTDQFRVNVNLNGWLDRSDPQAPQYQTLLAQAPATTSPALEAYPFAPFKARAADWTPSPRPHADNRLLQGSIRADWEVGHEITLTSISSYVDYRPKQGFETDGTALHVDDFYLDEGYIKSFSQELRAANSGSARLRWVLGANYEHSDVWEYQRQDFSEISTAPIFGYTGAYLSALQHLRNYAVFANAEYDLTSQVTLKGGARYTKADRKATLCTGDPGDGSFAGVFNSLANAIQFGFVPVAGFTPTNTPVPPIGLGCVPLNNITLNGQPPTYLPGAFKGTLNEDNVSWHVGVDYKPNHNTIVYANIAKGYKAGSFPIASAATWEQFLPVKQESLLDYDVGFRLTAFDRALALDGALFYYDYKNKQMRSKLVDPIFGVLDYLQNIPKSRMVGGELSATYRPPAIEGLILNVSGTQIFSEITKFTGYSASGVITDFKGSTIPYTPKFEIRGTADYSWRMGSLTPFAGLAVTYRTKAVANIGGVRGIIPPPNFASSVPFEETYTIPAYALLDLRVGVRGPDDAWSVTVFGKNVLDKYYITNIATDYDTLARYAGQPATYGVTIAGKFR